MLCFQAPVSVILQAMNQKEAARRSSQLPVEQPAACECTHQYFKVLQICFGRLLQKFPLMHFADIQLVFCKRPAPAHLKGNAVADFNFHAWSADVDVTVLSFTKFRSQSML